MPVRRLKYLPKTDWDGKFSSSLICWIVIEVEMRSALHSDIAHQYDSLLNFVEIYLPMQKFLKIFPRTSSVEISPTMEPRW